MKPRDHRARNGDGPTLLECKTYRFYDHVGRDFGLHKRPEDEIAYWRGRDPIVQFRAALIAQDVISDADAGAILERVRARIPPEPEQEDPPPGGEPTFSADEVQFDDKADQGTLGEVEMSALTDDQLAEMWMRRLSTSPADFLRRRFAMEAAAQ